MRTVESFSWLWISIGVLGAIVVIIGVWGEEHFDRKVLPYNRKERVKTAFWAVLLAGLSMDLIGLIGSTLTSTALESRVEVLRKANNAVESRLAWRVIPPEKRAKLVKELSFGPKGPVLIQCDFDVEAMTFESQIISILRDAGFEIRPPSIQLASFGYSDGTNAVFFLCESTNNVPLHARFIQDVFKSNDIFIPALAVDPATRKYIEHIKTTGSDGTAIIWVSKKP